MSYRTTVIVSDDINGEEGAEEVLFGLDGVEYAIDLGDKNAGALRDALAVYVGHGRKLKGSKSAKKALRPAARTADVDPAVIRAWAVEEGYEVSTRGRVSAAIRQAYQESNP